MGYKPSQNHKGTVLLGDARFSPAYAIIRDSPNRVVSIRQLSDEEVTAALAAASRAGDPLVANFLATEAMNRTLIGRAILESIRDGVIALDREGRITFLNSAAEAMLGQQREDRIGRDLTEFTTEAGGRDDKLLREKLMSPMSDGGSREIDHVIMLTSEGNGLETQVSTAPLMIHGAIRGVVLIVKQPPRAATSFSDPYWQGGGPKWAR